MNSAEIRLDDEPGRASGARDGHPSGRRRRVRPGISSMVLQGLGRTRRMWETAGWL
jgi:hypothetical protein